jgi:hypothetical protein
MTDRCISGKKLFVSQPLAEDVLIELWTRNEYVTGHAPIAVYKCDDCGYYHLTSREPMNEKLAGFLSDNKLKHHREANKWLDKFKRRK